MTNLDAMGSDDLMTFWATHHQGRQYKTLFPEGGKGRKRAAADLANYASNKSTAIVCRLNGKIETAMMYERIADGIYAGLPDFARW